MLHRYILAYSLPRLMKSVKAVLLKSFFLIILRYSDFEKTSFVDATTTILLSRFLEKGEPCGSISRNLTTIIYINAFKLFIQINIFNVSWLGKRYWFSLQRPRPRTKKKTFCEMNAKGQIPLVVCCRDLWIHDYRMRGSMWISSCADARWRTNRRKILRHLCDG